MSKVKEFAQEVMDALTKGDPHNAMANIKALCDREGVPKSTAAAKSVADAAPPEPDPKPKHRLFGSEDSPASSS